MVRVGLERLGVIKTRNIEKSKNQKINTDPNHSSRLTNNQNPSHPPF